MGVALLESGLAKEALPHLLDARDKNPKSWEALVNLGIAYRIIGDWPNSSAAYTQAIRLAPNEPAVWYNIAVCCDDFGHFADATEVLGPLYDRFPGNQQVALLYAYNTLRTGKWKEAWTALEVGRFQESWSPIPNLMIWQQEPIEGKKLLVLCEGGYGDSFLYQRYFARLKELGALVYFYLWDKQIEIFQGHPHIDGFVKNSEGADPKEYEFQIPLMSLPRIFDSTPDNVPPNVFVPKSSGREFDVKKNGKINVGLCWEAEETGNMRKVRSIPVEQLGPLYGENLQLHSLCLGQPPESVRKHDIGGWSHTAALIEKMDVVVSVDTAVAHLSCMLGKRTLIVLPPSSEWKWLLPPRTDSVWWPSAELFRTTPAETFEDTLKRVAERLR